MVKKFDRNFPNPPIMAQVIITVELSMFNPAIIIDAAASESPNTLMRFGVGAKYGFIFSLVLDLLSTICVC